jgi:hypothetical protein
MAGITYIKRGQIDIAAWDLCIAHSSRPLVYATSMYLDHICQNDWDALVLNNYEAVMPLPKKTKWGINIAYQPFFCQQLGLFAKPNSGARYEDFLKAIPRKFWRVILQLNPEQPFPVGIKTRKNLLLDLQKPYENIASAYNADARKNLRKCKDAGVATDSCNEFTQAIQVYKEAWGSLNPQLQNKHYQAFEKACKALYGEGKAFCLKATLHGELLAYAILLRSPKYLHYVCAAPTPAGRKLGVMHAVIDYVAETYANQGLWLDFEGSEIKEVASFYQKFGPLVEYYGVYRRGL